MNTLKVFLLDFILLFAFGCVIFAQEAPPTEEVPPEITEAVNLDEDIQPIDLEVEEPKILPDSPFYFIKNWARGIQSFFTFNPVAKTELRMKFANEKLMEVKKIIEKTKDPEIIKKAIKNYQKGIEEIKNRAEEIKENAKENPKVDRFLDKFIHQQTLHQKLLDRLETQVPPEAFEKIKEARERHLERFQEVMLKLEDRDEKITEKLNEILEKQKGSHFKNFKNLEILKDLEEKVPEEMKEAIKKARENTLKRLEGNLEKMGSEKQEKFNEYIERISGDKEKHLEILENLRQEIKEMPVPSPRILELREKLEGGKTKILEKIERKLEKLDCPLLAPLAPGFCKEGRVIIEKDARGCPSPRCIIPGETEIPKPPVSPGTTVPQIRACITLWDPVCGKDGKTYSNECFARLAKVEIAYKGECKEISKIKKESYCQTDDDCACGVKRDSRECFYGNKEYVDTTYQCPDFCEGIHGGYIIKCVENECKQVWRSR